MRNMYTRVAMSYSKTYEDMIGKGKVIRLVLIPFLLHKLYKTYNFIKWTSDSIFNLDWNENKYWFEIEMEVFSILIQT